MLSNIIIQYRAKALTLVIILDRIINMNAVAPTMKNGLNMGKYIWGVILIFNLLVLWDIFFNNARGSIDFLFYVTGGYK